MVVVKVLGQKGQDLWSKVTQDEYQRLCSQTQSVLGPEDTFLLTPKLWKLYMLAEESVLFLQMYSLCSF